MTIRRGVASDAAAVADVYIASRRAAVPNLPPMRQNADDVRHWFASIVLVAHEVWVGVLDERIVGIVVVRGDSLDQLYVLPAHQRHGVGSRLLEHVKRHRRLLRLQTFQSNEPAREFYGKRGFRVIAYGDGTANEEGAPDVLYEWKGIIR